MAVDSDITADDLGMFNLDPGVGNSPAGPIMNVTSVPRQVYPQTTADLLAPTSITQLPSGTNKNWLVPGQAVNLAPPSPVNVGQPTPTAAPVIPQGSVAPPVQLAENVAPGQQPQVALPPTRQPALPSAQPVPVAPVRPAQTDRAGPMPGAGQGVAGSILQPPVGADPNTSQLFNLDQNYKQELARLRSIADNPQSQFWFGASNKAARDQIPEVEKKIFENQQKMQEAQKNLTYAKNLNLTGPVSSLQTADASNEQAVSEYKNGNWGAGQGLVSVGQQARVVASQPQAMQAMDKNNAKATELFGKLDKIGQSDAEYARSRAEVLTEASKNPMMQQYNLTEDKIPLSKPAYLKQSGIIQGPLRMIGQEVNNYKTAQANMMTPVTLTGDAAAGVTESSTWQDGSAKPRAIAKSLPSLGGQRATLIENSTADPADYRKGGKWNNWNEGSIKTAQEMMKEPELKGVLNQHKLAVRFNGIVQNDDNFRTAAGQTVIADSLGGVFRDMAESAQASGNVGLSKLNEYKMGVFERLANDSMTNWSAYKAWVTTGQGPEVKPDFRLTPATIKGLKDIAKFNLEETSGQLPRLSGVAKYVGKMAGDLTDAGISREAAAYLEPTRAASEEQARRDWDKPDRIIIRGRTYELSPDHNVDPSTPGFIKGGSYAAGLQNQGSRVQPQQPPAPVVHLPVQPVVNGGQPLPGQPPAQPPVQPVNAGYNPATYQAGIGAGESGNNYAARPNSSGASGKYQFVPGTWDANKPPGAPDAAWKATAEQQDQAFKTFTGKNAVSLQSNGIPVNNLTLAIAHQQGASGAKSLLSAPDNAIALQQVDRNNAAANPDFFWDKATGKPLTVAESKAKFAQFYRTGAQDTAAAQPAAPGIFQRATDFVSGRQPGETEQQAYERGSAATNKTIVRSTGDLAKPALATTGAIGGGVVGGIPGAVAGGVAGGTLGGLIQERLNKPEDERNYLAAGTEGAGEGLIAAIPGGEMLPTAARVIGGGLVGGGGEAIRGGTTGQVFNAAVGGVLGAAGGEAFGQLLGMAGHMIYNRFSGAAKAEIQDAAQILAEQKPRIVDATGKSVENTAYTKAKATVESAGLDAEHAAYAYNQVANKANKGDALTQRPGAIEAARVGKEQYDPIRQQIAEAPKAKGAMTLEHDPTSLIGKSVPDTQAFREAAATAKNTMINGKSGVPAKNMREVWDNHVDARAALLTKEREAMSMTGPGRQEAMDAYRAMANKVRDQQRVIAEKFLPKDQADSLMINLENADVRYQKAMEAGGPDIVKTISAGDAKGNQAKAAFDALAHDDPIAQRMMNALVAAQKRTGGAGDNKLFHIALTAANLLHAIPVVGTAVGSVATVISLAKLKQMGIDYMTRRGAGERVKFKDLVEKEFPQLTAGLRQGGAAVGTGMGVNAARAMVAPAGNNQATQ